MEKARNKVVDFLKQHGMDFEDIDMEGTSALFLEEMRKGLAGEDSSLPMIPTYIELQQEVPINERVIAVDAGGTNFRVAVVHFDEDRKPILQEVKGYLMPGVKEEVSKPDFFRIMAEYIQPAINQSHTIGLCFSYPTEVFPNRDGKLIHLSKEIKAPEVEGEMIGENLAVAIRSLGHDSQKHIVLLNDTVATLLAGKAGFANRAFASYVGFILGTGTNCCYIEQNRNVTKKKDLDPDKAQIINVESGSFGRAPRGAVDIEFDEGTVNAGEWTFEKMISGAYLGRLCLHTGCVAGEQGLLSAQTTKQLKGIVEIDTKDIDEFMCHPSGKGHKFAAALQAADEKDVVTLYHLFDRLIERAAKLTAINLSAMVLKSKAGGNPCSPVCIVAEGTTFYRLRSLKTRVEYYLTKYLEKEKRNYYEIVSVEDATLIGAAIAGLTN